MKKIIEKLQKVPWFLVAIFGVASMVLWGAYTLAGSFAWAVTAAFLILISFSDEERI